MLRTLTVLSFLYSGLTFAVGFKSGNEFHFDTVDGTISVSCPGNSTGQPSYATFSCYGTDFGPKAWDKFIYDQDIDADKVVLIARHEDGSKKKKSSKYDAKKRQSKKAFRLWYGTLFQHPLLDEGVNEVEYKLYKKKELVASGSFTVNVNRGERITCGHRYYTGYGNDCVYSSRLCDEYIRRCE